MTEVLKSQKFKEEIYPPEFSDDDKLKYDEYWELCSRLPHRCDPWIVKMLIIAQINMESGRGVPPNPELSQRLKEQYMKNIQSVYYTPKRDDVEEEIKNISI